MANHYKVKFKDELYWWHGFNISPLDHYSDNGELLANPFRDISYAIVLNENIIRFEEVIGHINDLEIISKLEVEY